VKIAIAMGFFLPMPPAAGGATEKSWHRLSVEFARRGHEVTVLSRRWPGWPDRETIDGVRHVRLPGHDHSGSLPGNLFQDLLWSLRVGRALPPADVTIVNCLALPVWLGWFRGSAGRLAVMTGRIPKGQYRLYRRLDRVLAVSSPVRDSVVAENPILSPIIRVCGYPIDWTSLSRPRPERQDSSPLVIGYVGRIHREKGLDVLAGALLKLAAVPSLPPWRAVFCGPVGVAQGGSGEAYAGELRNRLSSGLKPGRWEILPAMYAEEPLVQLYRKLDIFCYPSLAAKGETFGVAVAEAMAAGAVPVVSNLACFADFVRPGENGRAFEADGPGAADSLCAILAGLLSDPAGRSRMSRAATEGVAGYDFVSFADRLIADFSAWNRPGGKVHP
jgi:glycosyltransferase involved in cell wall biosynthesis